RPSANMATARRPRLPIAWRIALDDFSLIDARPQKLVSPTRTRRRYAYDSPVTLTTPPSPGARPMVVSNSRAAAFGSVVATTRPPLTIAVRVPASDARSSAYR